jgi:hypothetical protein
MIDNCEFDIALNEFFFASKKKEKVDKEIVTAVAVIAESSAGKMGVATFEDDVIIFVEPKHLQMEGRTILKQSSLKLTSSNWDGADVRGTELRDAVLEAEKSVRSALKGKTFQGHTVEVTASTKYSPMVLINIRRK